VKKKASKKTIKRTGTLKKSPNRKKAVGKTRVKAAVKMKRPVERPQAPYVAPRRIYIKDAVCALLPHVDPKLVKGLEYWALYTIHQDVVKDGKDAESLARKLIKGYDPAGGAGLNPKRVSGAEKGRERSKREQEVAARAEAAKERALAAKERVRAAKERARAVAHAAKERARAAMRAARDKARAARLRKSKPSAAPEQAGAKAAAPVSRAVGSTYVAPVRTKIRDALVKVMPMIKMADLAGLDYWQLYTMHSEIVKYGRNPEDMARKFVKGYTKAKK
jgi:hypothetical protein